MQTGINKSFAMYHETARAELILLCRLRRLLELPISAGPFQLLVGHRIIKSRLPKLVSCLRIRAGFQELDENVGILAVSRREQKRGLINVVLSIGVRAALRSVETIRELGLYQAATESGVSPSMSLSSTSAPALRSVVITPGILIVDRGPHQRGHG